MHKKHKGFTFIEVLVVLVVLGISSSYVIGLLTNMMQSWQLGISFSQLQSGSALAHAVTPQSLRAVDAETLTLTQNQLTAELNGDEASYPIILNGDAEFAWSMSRLSTQPLSAVNDLTVSCGAGASFQYDGIPLTLPDAEDCEIDYQESHQQGRPDWLEFAVDFTVDDMTLHYRGGSDVY